MGSVDVKEILNLTPKLLSIPFKRVWYSYDEEADVLYLNFKKPSHADDTELTDDDIIIRYEIREKWLALRFCMRAKEKKSCRQRGQGV